MTPARSRGDVSDLLARTAEVQMEADGRGASPAASGRGPDRRIVRRCYGAKPEAVPLARAAVARLARAASVPEPQLQAIRLAVSEAVTNVVVHAYGDAEGCVHLTAALAGGELIVLVADDGRGPRNQQRTGRRGWGWPVIAASSDEFTITERDNGGTQVEIRWALPAPRPDSASIPERLGDAVLAAPSFSATPRIDQGAVEPGAETTNSP
jgi:serine/threonine-protein kinase RsbW